ncbi:MAG: hypothetical protein WEA04_04760 [Candidatus Andersenbacteria bacterium]
MVMASRLVFGGAVRDECTTSREVSARQNSEEVILRGIECLLSVILTYYTTFK